jgi:hypothetical protein
MCFAKRFWTLKKQKKGDVAGDISKRMHIELCNPQARSNSLLFWQKSLFGKNIMNVLCFYSLITLQNRKKGDVAGDKEVWDTYICTLEQVEEKQQTLWA